MSTATIKAGQRATRSTIGGGEHAAPRDPRPWAVYGRISKRKAGDGVGASLGIGRQHEDCVGYVHSKFGADAPVLVFADNMSAWAPDVERPDWEDMLSMLRRGELAGVIAWHPDRLTRQPMQLEQLLADAKEGRAQLHTALTGHVESQLMLRILLAVAAEESDHKSRRITRKHDEMATTGKAHGGRRRFGYEPGMAELREGQVPGTLDEAAILRDLGARLLNGESLASLVRWLKANDVPTASGGKWTGPNLGTMLRRPMLAGFRTHNGEVVAKAEWPAIFDETTHRLIVAKLTDPARRTTTGNATKYLLSGLGRCAECGEVLRGRPGRHDKASTVYQCASTRHVHRSAELVDAAVEALVVERLSRADAFGALVDDAAEDEMRDLMLERDALNLRLDGLMEQHLSGGLDAADWQRANGIAKDRLATLDRALNSATVKARAPKVLEGFTGPGAQAAWDVAPLARRKAIIRFLCTVSVVGTSKTRRAFDPERDVVVEWK